jgi:hypothetical protein
MCLDDREGTLTEEGAAAHTLVGSDRVETFDEIVVELDENLLPGHSHMISHMILNQS